MAALESYRKSLGVDGLTAHDAARDLMKKCLFEKGFLAK